jgi:hypothetical protein
MSKETKFPQKVNLIMLLPLNEFFKKNQFIDASINNVVANMRGKLTR